MPETEDTTLGGNAVGVLVYSWAVYVLAFLIVWLGVVGLVAAGLIQVNHDLASLLLALFWASFPVAIAAAVCYLMLGGIYRIYHLFSRRKKSR